ncbi:hypothetical protein HZB93_01320 [Candidatus Falkowbacteria bacterium]|nr:hypothetical protein [Candidatus Falkowbacteria bacterium]
MKSFFIKVIIITSVFISLLALWRPAVSLALMNSESYINWMDSLNFGGEETSTSTNYKFKDTLGEIGTGRISSTNYAGLIGFRQSEADPKMTFAISDTLINFGTLSPSAVSSDSITITTTTNAVDGYVTTIEETENLKTSGGADINDVSDGSVTAGSEEYGIRTSGSAGQMNGADTAIITSSQTVASYGSWINGSAVTITFKAAISTTTAAGVYTHNVTLISTGRF